MMFVVDRTWDEDGVVDFQRKRDELRAKRGLPPMHALEQKDKVAALQEEKDTMMSVNDMKRLTLAACRLEKYPLQQCTAVKDGFLICPKTLRGNKTLSDKIRCRKGDNLFLLAYNHYSQSSVGPAPGQNYISDDGISAKRHEFLGPSPCVAGFLERGGTVEILFWDSYIQLAWIHDSTWKVAAQFDETVEAWLPVIRSVSI